LPERFFDLRDAGLNIMSSILAFIYVIKILPKKQTGKVSDAVTDYK